MPTRSSSIDELIAMAPVPARPPVRRAEPRRTPARA